jgi:hypothetical protein
MEAKVRGILDTPAFAGYDDSVWIVASPKDRRGLWVTAFAGTTCQMVKATPAIGTYRLA